MSRTNERAVYNTDERTSRKGGLCVKKCWIKNREYEQHECNSLRDST